MLRDGKEMIDKCLNCAVADCNGTCKKARRGRRGKLYEIDGVEDTLTGWARRHGMTRQTVYERMRAGCTIREALEKQDGRRKKRYVIDGEADTVEGWARRKGFAPRVIRYRMKQGQTLKEALGMPVRRYGRELDGRMHILSARGRALGLAEWAKMLNVKRMTLYMYLRNHGWDMEATVAYYEKKTGVVIDAETSGDSEKGGHNSGEV